MYAQNQSYEGTAFSKDCDDNGSPRVSQNKADFAHCTNAQEYYAGNQAVAEGQVVNRLQEVNLHDINQFCRIGNQRIQEQGTQLAAIQEQHAAVNTNHTNTHRHHNQRLEDTFKAQVS